MRVTSSGLPELAPAEAPSAALAVSGVVAQYGGAVLMVAGATAVAFPLHSFVGAPSLTLFYVLPAVAAAFSFGWGPSLVAAILGVLAYDFFFTRPYESLAIASPTDLVDTALLLTVAAVVIAISAEGRRRARAADVAAAQTEALQRLARAVIERRPSKEVTQAAARALNRMFRIPAVVLTERDGAFELAGRAGVEKLKDADREAAVAAVAARAPTRGGEYPVDAARFDFWPFGSGGSAVVIGLDFSDADDGHPRDLARLVELVGGYVAAARMLDSQQKACG